MNFRIGQKVVCVDGGNWVFLLDEHLPVKGQVYTVRGFSPSARAIFLEEIINEPRIYIEGLVECSFMNHRFRPVVERKIETDIAVFTKMLKTRKLERL